MTPLRFARDVLIGVWLGVTLVVLVWIAHNSAEARDYYCTTSVAPAEGSC